MAKPSKIKIDVTKILKEHLFRGEKGTYLNCSVWENREGPDKYGNTHCIKQEISREARDAGAKEPIIGNLTLVTGADSAPRQQQRSAPQSRGPAPGSDPHPDKSEFDW